MFSHLVRLLRFRRLKLIFFLSIFVWYLITFLIVVPIWCRRQPAWCNPHLHHTFDVQEPSDLDLDVENFERVEAAEKWLNEYADGGARFREDIGQGQGAQVTMAIIAQKRPFPKVSDLRYLTQVLAEVIKTADRISSVYQLKYAKKLDRYFKNGTKSAPIMNISVFICNVDAAPAKFEEALQLSQYVHMITRSQKSIESTNRFDKEKSDYAFCLRAAAERTKPNGFVVMFEDDAFPVHRFDHMLMSIIDQLSDHRHRYIDYFGYDPPVFVKFYHPERYRKLPWLVLMVGYSLVLVSPLITMLISAGIRNRYFGHFIFWLFVYLVALFWCLGHRSVAQIRYLITGSIYLVAQESCCTPVVMFTTEAGWRVIDYMEKRKAYHGYGKDHMLDEMGNVQGLMTDMNLIRHIGRYTTLRGKPVRSDVW